MKILFLGTGEAFSKRANTSVLVDERILLDCGPTTPTQLFAAGCDLKRIELIYISHLHADHVFGLPSFLVACKEEGREEKLTVIGPLGIKEYISELLDMAYRKGLEDMGFEAEIREAEGAMDFMGYGLSFAPTEHSVACNAVSLEKELKLTYTGDGKPTDQLIALAEGSDLLIAEAYGEEAEGHSSLIDAAWLAKKADVKALAAVHISRGEDPGRLSLAAKIFAPILLPEDLDELGI